jgi:uncharacterized protein YfaS (alpha-2-macroglobulin family)
VVAGADGAFGSAERSMLVKQPLMVQATLPRVLGPGEELRVPVSVFVLDESIRDVELSVSADQRLSVVGDAKVALQFKGSGDELGFLRLKVGDRLGKARVKFVASAGKERAEHVIDIEVRPSNPEITRVQRGIAEPNRSLALGLTPLGLPGTNQTSLEVSSVPALNLNERLQFLIRYPYGCVEQTTSAAFPQLYLGKLLALEEGEQKRTQQNVEAAIERLRSFQQPDGSFAYWPGGHAHHDWATNYVGHFLVEAKRAGFSVPANLLASWRAHQKARAQSYLAQGRDAALDQAYRLYVLALSGAAELGAMNRLREQDSLPNVARWMLAAAYHEAGLADVARQLAAGGDLTVSRYDTEGLTFGSDLRDRAILLTALVTLDDAQRAGDLAVAVSEGLNDGHWHSTQSLSWALTSLGRMVGADGAPRRLSFEYVLDGGAPQRVDADKPVHQLALKSVGDKPAQVEVRNPTGGRLFINLANRGIPPVGEERASSDGLSMKVEFTDADGRVVDVDALPQGRDVRARVTVRNTGERHLENLALTQLLPSGWELETVRSAQDGESAFDYRDFRDDRMNTYFPLRSGEERTFLMRFTATYPGRYYLPGWSVEAMYDAKRHARTTGRWVTVRDTARGESER